MKHIRSAFARIAGLFTGRRVDDDLRDELEAHLEMETAENIRRGMHPDEARRQALIASGGMTFAAEAVRDQRGLPWIDDIASDIRYALRTLRRAPGFTSVVVITLALGIGANTAMFTLLRGTVLRPLPNKDAERLVYLHQAAPGAKDANTLFSVPEVEDYRAAASSLSELAEYSSALPFTLVAKDGHPVRARIGVISGNYFSVMGLGAAVGRVTTSQDDGPSASPVVVLSYRYWMEHFGGDSSILGSVVQLNARPTTIIGVAQPAPEFPSRTDAYVNTVVSPHHLGAQMNTDRVHRMTELFARLAPNTTVERARDDVNRVAATMFKDHPEIYQKAAQYVVSVSPLRSAVNERAALMFSLLMGAAGFVLLIACANVSNLTLMRGVIREREMLVRAALGAGTMRLRRLLITENLALSLLGGALGVIVAFAAVKLLTAFAAQLSPRASEIRVDRTVLAMGLATSVVVAFVLSFIPRISGDGSLGTSMAPASRRTTLGRGRQRVQRLLVVTQLAACMILLTAAGLLGRTMVKLMAVETGVRTDHVLTLDLPLTGDLLREIMKQPENLARYQAIRDRVSALPGVQLASVSAAPPMRSSLFSMDLKVENHPVEANQIMPHALVRTVDTAYLRAAGIPLVAGRNFASTDVRGSEKVILLNRSFAHQLFGDENPIGKHVAFTGAILKLTPFSGDWRTVVGVVGDTRDQGLDGAVSATLYAPFAQEFIVNGALVVRSSGDPDALKGSVQRVIREMYPQQLIENVATLDQIRDEAVAPRRLNAMFIMAFGALAFIIAMVGIAGVLAFSVSSRTAEIGIRMSLGADAGRVRRMILGEGGILLVGGLAVGVSGALLAARLLSGMLFGITAHDPLTVVAVATVLLAVGVAACWLPAARAARVDPAVALRSE
jgi:predicted permease